MMKKNYLFVLFFVVSLGLQAQIFSAGFEDNNGTPLSEFKIVNNDSIAIPDWAEVPEFNEEGWIQFFDGPDNKIAFSTSNYYGVEGASDDWLITPAIEIPEEGTPTLYWKAKSYDIENMDDYEVRISVSDDELESFDEVLLSVTEEQPFDFKDRQLDLSDYKGETIYLAFVNVTEEGYFLAIDDLYISASEDCMLPSLDNLEITAIDEQGFTVTWENQDISSFDVGLTTFDVPVSSDGVQSENSKTFSGLEPGTRYQLFLKNADCGSGWTSPKSIRTALIPPYSYDFEYTEENFGEYDSDGWSSDSWVNSSGGDRAQSGDGYVFNNTNTNIDSDAWIYSPAMKLEAGEELVITYYMQLASEAPTSAEAEVVLANAQTKSAHLTVIDSQTIEADIEEYQELTAVIAPEETGIYYIGFGNVTPQVPLDAPLRLDNIQFKTQELGIEKEEISQVKVYPNPVQDFLHLQSEEPIKNVEVYGIDGKHLNLPINQNKIDFSSVSNGVYFVKIETTSGKEIKKVVK